MHEDQDRGRAERRLAICNIFEHISLTNSLMMHIEHWKFLHRKYILKKKRTRGQAHRAQRQQSVKSGDREDALHPHVVLLEQCTCGKEPGQLHSCHQPPGLGLPLSPSSLEHCALCQPEEESGFHLFEGWGEDGYQVHLSGWGQGLVWIWGWWWW